MCGVVSSEDRDRRIWCVAQHQGSIQPACDLVQPGGDRSTSHCSCSCCWWHRLSVAHDRPGGHAAQYCMHRHVQTPIFKNVHAILRAKVALDFVLSIDETALTTFGPSELQRKLSNINTPATPPHLSLRGPGAQVKLVSALGLLAIVVSACVRICAHLNLNDRCQRLCCHKSSCWRMLAMPCVVRMCTPHYF